MSSLHRFCSVGFVAETLTLTAISCRNGRSGEQRIVTDDLRQQLEACRKEHAS